MKNLIFFLFIILSPILSFSQLTGYWQTDVGGCYQVRQEGNQVWWIAERTPNTRASVAFHGVLTGNILTGQWCDMPSHDRQNCGEQLSLRVENNNRMVKTGETISYNGNVWTKTNSANCESCPVAWKQNLASCSSEICGRFSANQGMYAFSSGNAQVTVCKNGDVKISLPALTNRSTGQPVGRKSFEVFYGTFGNQQWNGDQIGKITTQANGSFEGLTGIKVKLPITKSFVLNSDGRSQFITVPQFYPQPVDRK